MHRNKGQKWAGTEAVGHQLLQPTSTPMSSAATLVENGGWGGYESLDAVPRILDVRGDTFA